MSKKVLLLLLFVLMCASVQAYDAEDSFSINDTQLPYAVNTTLTINANQGDNFTITQFNSSDIISVSFENSFTLENSTSYSVPFQLTVLNHSLVASKNISVGFNVTKNENTSSSYGVLFEIEKTIQTFVVEEFQDFAITNNGYEINITTNLLPVESELEFRITSDHNQTMNITGCGEWLNCPSNFTFTDNSSALVINYTIPLDAEVGTHEQGFSLVGINRTREANITFNILEPSVEFFNYVFTEDCFESDSTMAGCLEQQRRELIEFQALQRAAQINNTVIEEIEVPVMVGSIDDELLEIYEGLEKQYQTLLNEYETTSQLKTSLEEEKAAFDERLTQMEDYVDGKEADIKKQQEQFEAEKEQQKKKRRNNIILLIVVVGLIGGYTYLDMKYNGYGVF